jgi:serine/threonine-protein kinase RsbT
MNDPRAGPPARTSRPSDGALPVVTQEARVPILSDADILAARQKGRALAAEMGFTSSSLTMIATAISELARNIVLYARRGEIVLGRIEENGRKAVVVMARDEGPGIPDIDLAMQSGYSTSGSLGLGLPGVRRMMDEFGIFSEVGKGTSVTVKKWKR